MHVNNIEDFLKLDVKDFHYLKSLSLDRNVTSLGCSSYRLVMILSNQSGEGLRMEFNGVLDLKLGNTDGLFIVAIDIEDLRSSYLDGISYKVSDLSNQILSFFCRDFSINFLTLNDQTEILLHSL